MTLEICEKISNKPFEALKIGKRLFYSQLNQPTDVALCMASEAMARNMLDPRATEGFQAFVEKRDPSWKT